MPKHTWSFAVRTDSGGGPVDSLVVSGPAEINIGNSGVSLFSVPPTDVLEWDGSITVANLLSFFMEGDTDIEVRINSWTSPAALFDITAKQALGWNNQNLPQGVANPLAGVTTITKIYVYNKGTVKGVVPTTGAKTCNFQAGFLLNQEVTFS